MSVRVAFAGALMAGAMLATLASPVPARDPVPAPALAPLDSSSPSPGRPLKTLGHIYTSAFCTRFVTQFNVAAGALVENDRHLDSVDESLSQIQVHYTQRDGALRVYDDRVRLINTVANMMKTIPVGQRAINDLLAQANETTDAQRRTELHESASQMQRSIDRQRAVSYDLSNVIHVLMDKHGAQDTVEYQIASLLPAGSGPVRVDALDAPVPEAGSDFSAELTQTPANKHLTTVQDVMQFGRQRWIIGAAESKAAVAANLVERTCSAEGPSHKL
ncbi:MAG: hypothetical protein GIW99_04155 [Candidatus Eremiobacteraeota bacterium]|nr:hypothetical protein [Candidatus Eremiobacteraeota bacterium]MBC5826865.1 hypothetical protein [Candidatus Eremiobacteraeota bacterium]